MHNFFFTTSGKKLVSSDPQKEAKCSLAGLWSITLFSLPGSLDSLSNKKQ